MGQIGNFLTPIFWGVAKYATGNYQTGLMTLTMMTMAMAALTLLLRRQVRRA